MIVAAESIVHLLEPQGHGGTTHLSENFLSSIEEGKKKFFFQSPPWYLVSPRIVAIIMVCHIIIIMYAAILRHFFEGPIMTSCNSRGTSFLSKIYVQHTGFVSSLYATITFHIVILPIFSDNMPFPKKKKDLAY